MNLIEEAKRRILLKQQLIELSKLEIKTIQRKIKELESNEMEKEESNE